MEDNEIWRIIDDYPKYEVSSTGVIRQIETKKIVQLEYPKVALKNDDYRGNNTRKVKYVPVHRIMAKAFIPNPETKPFVNHKDGVKTNFNLDNLQWSTHKENVSHAIQTGLADYERCRNFPVVGKNMRTLEVKEWSSTRKAAKELGYSSTTVSAACLGKQGRVGYWKFVFKKDLNENSFSEMKYVNRYNTKPVLQMDKITGEVIKEYASAREANTVTGTSFTKICSVCKGNRQTAGGFKWKYKET